MAAPTERVFPAAPATIGRGLVASSFQYYLSGEDNLRVDVHSNTVGRLLVQGRIWREADRSIQVFEYNLPLDQTSGTPDTHFIKLDTGALLNLRVSTSSNPLPYGAAFVRVQLVRGLTTAAVALGTLLQGYISDYNDMGWPGTPLQHMHDGRGQFVTGGFVVLLAPLRVVHTVSAGERHRFLFGRVTVSTSAVVANRFVLVQIATSGGSALYSAAHPTAITASSSINISVAPVESTPDVAGALFRTQAIPPDLELHEGATVTVQITNEQAGDTLLNAQAAYLRWIDV